MLYEVITIIREAARCHFNLTEVANTLYTSQSGVSRHIKELEDELGVELFVRRGKRLLGIVITSYSIHYTKLYEMVNASKSTRYLNKPSSRKSMCGLNAMN